MSSDEHVDTDRLQQIQQALSSQELTPNQRKKYRKKLSRLFHGSGSQGEASEMSSLQGGSACTGHGGISTYTGVSAAAASPIVAPMSLPLHMNKVREQPSSKLGFPHMGASVGDMSSFMRMIASEMKAMDPPPASLPSLVPSPSLATSQRSKGTSTVCRHDLSYSMSVISVELDQDPQQGHQPQAPPFKDLPSKSNKNIKENCPGTSKESSREGKKRKRVFLHGNYHNYYGYRTLGEIDSDPRLSKLDPSWFRGKELLDIGCNEGLVTLALSAGFCCKRALGVDIDETLIHRARGNLSSMRADLTLKLKGRIGGLGGVGQVEGQVKGEELCDIRESLKALSNTSFKPMDWSRGRAKGESFDVITCLSVTKWIHLNGGDVAIKRLFEKIHESLVDGGLLVLEPQPWKSYKAALSKQRPLKKAAMDTEEGDGGGGGELPASVGLCQREHLKLRPEMFLEYLKTKVGFELVVELNKGRTSQNFDRPFYVLRKRLW